MKQHLTRRQWVRALLALVATFVLVGTVQVIGAGHADAAMNVKTRNVEVLGRGVPCTGEYRKDTAHKNDGTLGNDEWWFHMTVLYDYCYPRNGLAQFVRVNVLNLGYNFEGSSGRCPGSAAAVILGTYVHHVDADPYFWSALGENFNPGKVVIPCDESTMNSKTQRYEHPPLLHVGGGTAPKAKANWHVEKGTLVAEPEATTYVTLRPCSGYGSTPCN